MIGHQRLPNKAIADLLGVTLQTVKNDLTAAFQVLGATNRLDAAVIAGYLVPSEPVDTSADDLWPFVEGNMARIIDAGSFRASGPES